MLGYILKRLLLIIPTLFAVMVINFLVVQVAPGGPVERILAELKSSSTSTTARISQGGTTALTAVQGSDLQAKYKGSKGLDERFRAELEKLYGFDKPPLERFWLMLKGYVQFDFGTSFLSGRSVIATIGEKLPVSISLGLWTTLLVYLISIPLGVRKAVLRGSPFDVWTSVAVVVGYALPSFLFAIFLITVFGMGGFFDLFPLRGIVSDNWNELPLFSKLTDYLWHMVLPIASMVVSGFAGLTLLTKNTFLEEMKKNYVQTARAKGLAENKVLYGHVFRNAMLVIVSGFPAAFIGILFTGSLLIEVIFSLDGLGLLGFEAALNRDYPVLFATLYIYTLLGLAVRLMGDVAYMLIDPRIDFSAKNA